MHLKMGMSQKVKYDIKFLTIVEKKLGGMSISEPEVKKPLVSGEADAEAEDREEEEEKTNGTV